VLVLDAGTGLAGLAATLAAAPAAVSILLTGFGPDCARRLSTFFSSDASAVLRDARLYAPAALPADPRAADAFAPSRAVTYVGSGDLDVAGFDIRAQAVEAPHGTLAYRIRGSSSDLVYISALEFGDDESESIGGTLAPFAFNSGATVLGADWHHATEFASATGAGRLWLLRHDSHEAEEELQNIEARARRVYPASRVAREGDAFRL
jgi:hypothetical protein